MTGRRLPQSPKKLDAIPGQRQVDAQTMAMIVSLASETTILRARLDACERLLVAAKLLAPGAIDAFSPDPAAQIERDRQRTQSMAKIFRSLQEGAAAEWRRIVDTALPTPDDFLEQGVALEQTRYLVAPRSIVVLLRS